MLCRFNECIDECGLCVCMQEVNMGRDLPSQLPRLRERLAYHQQHSKPSVAKRFLKRHPWLQKEGKMIDEENIKDEAFQLGRQKMWDDSVKELHTPITNREAIAILIRNLTYRELMQIATEIEKCTSYTDIAQTLDDWAHMVKDEDDPYKGHTMAGEPFVDK